MATFEELFGALRNYDDSAEDAPPISTIYDSLEEADNNYSAGAKANLSTKDERIKELESEISKLQSHNYNLMMQAPKNVDDDEPGGDKDDAPQGVSGLFKMERRNR